MLRDGYLGLLETPLLHCFIFVFFILHLTVRYQGSWCQSQGPTKDTVFPHLPSHRHHRYQAHERRLAQEQKKLESWAAMLKRMETELRRQYPKQVLNIMHLLRPDLPWIYVITPTYERAVQKAELTRMVQTFLHVPNLHWILVEDAQNETALVKALLKGSGLVYTHLCVKTPAVYKLLNQDPSWLKPRGVLQRNVGLKWIEEHLKADRDRGVLYFADDDNTYDMRLTSSVSVWPVGLVGYLRYESPIVEKGKVTGFFTYWKPERPFPMDMAGFAINIRLLLSRQSVMFHLEVERGYQESTLLSQLVTRADLEPRADNCTKVLVWHTRTEKPSMKNEELLRRRSMSGSDLMIEV